jgi:hypothetical protein
METWIWVLVGIAAVLVALVFMSRRHTSLEERFGPEYDRALERADSPREAKRELKERVKRHRELELRPLSPDDATAYAQRWFVVQSEFVDDPSRACQDAGVLLDEVLRARGYPVDEDFDSQADLVSVDHPQLVTEYRTAHEATARGVDDDSGTEDLRTAFVAYRNLFSELLDQQADDTRADADIDLTTADEPSVEEAVDEPVEEDAEAQSPRA